MFIGVLLFVSLFASMPYSECLKFKMPETVVEEMTAEIYEIVRDGLLQMTSVRRNVKNLLLGLPIHTSISIINSVCAQMLADREDTTIHPVNRLQPKREYIKLELRTPCRTSSYALPQIRDLLNDPDFDAEKKTAIFATGWTTTVDDVAHRMMEKAYHCRGDTNYLALDVGNYIRTRYYWSALNTVNIGQLLAESLTLLNATTVQQFHLIGHSLGAQIMGTAARHYHNLTGQLLAHVTGLDPAFGCFNEGEALTTLSASDAQFVDIIHTSSGTAGQRAVTGSVDFFAGGRFPLQAGCLGIVCSHQRAWKYYAESVYPGNERNFLAKRCTSLHALLTGLCIGAEYPMGHAVPHDLEGRYILQVNAKPPFGANATEHFQSFDSDCGQCEEDDDN